MNTQNYTQKTVEAIQNAQNIARENDNQSLVPEHLLYSLLDQDGGLIPSLFGKMGVDCNTVLGELDSYIATLPKVSGGEMYLSSETDRVIRTAEKTAKTHFRNTAPTLSSVRAKTSLIPLSAVTRR